MTRWLEWLFGARLSGRGDASDWHVDWASAPAGGDGVLLIMVLALLIGWAIWWLYRRDADDLTPRRRWTLIALRVTAILLVLAMFLEPVLVIEREEDYPSNLVILQDISASMQIKDGVDDPIRARDQAAVLGLASPEEVGNLSRTDLANLARSEGLEEALRADGDRRVHRHEFADQLFLDREPDPQRRRSAQQYTAIGGALEQVLAAYEGQPLSGILLVTDGQSNAGPAMQRSAEAAAAAQVPIHVLGLGSDQKARNAAIAKVEANEVVFVADPIEVKVWVDARGMTSEVAAVRLERSVDGGSWETLKTAEIVFGDSGQLTELSFEDALDRPAKIDYRASLEGVGREVTTDDNVSGTRTQVVKKKIRALLVAGLAFPEVQFLINTLMRDQSIDVSSWLMFAERDYKQKGNEIITRLPQTAEELDAYDCVILYDTDLKEMPANFGSLLVDFVGQDGGGLVYIAGESATADLFDRKRAGAEDICNLLPVIREPGVFRSRVEMRLSAQTEWKFELTAAGREAGLFRFEEDAEQNARTLEALPGMYWHFPVTREKPGATVLARHGDARMSNAHGRHVVLATQRFGPGRTYFLGLDSSYRWRFLDDKYFDGFWGRLVNRAALAKRLGGRQPFSLRTDQQAYAPGSVVTLRAELRDLEEVSVDTQSIVAEIESGDEGSEPLIFSQVDGQIGIFEAQYPVRRSGPHFVRAWAGESPQPGARPVTYEFRVEFPNRELAAPSLDRARLSSLAQATGGRLFALEEVNQIADAFKTRRVARRELERQELWDGLVFWGLALLLIFIEWVLRKRYRLV